MNLLPEIEQLIKEHEAKCAAEPQQTALETSQLGFVTSVKGYDVDILEGQGQTVAAILGTQVAQLEAAANAAAESIRAIDADGNLSEQGKAAKREAVLAQAKAAIRPLAIEGSLDAIESRLIGDMQRAEATEFTTGNATADALRAAEIRRHIEGMSPAERVSFYCNNAGNPEIAQAVEGGPLPLLDGEIIARIKAARCDAKAPELRWRKIMIGELRTALKVNHDSFMRGVQLAVSKQKAR